MNYPRIASFITAIFAVAITGSFARADTIQITEYSSTNLVATFNGLALNVQNTAPDFWTITGGPFGPGSSGMSATWIEPEGGLYNNLIVNPDYSLAYFSNAQTLPYIFPIENGLSANFVEHMIMGPNGSMDMKIVAVTVNDVSNSTRSVPDSGLTAVMLCGTLAGAIALRRRLG